MDPTSALQQALIDAQKMLKPQANQFHVLVVTPEPAQQQEASKRGDVSTTQLLKMAVAMNERVIASLDPPLKWPRLKSCDICYNGWLARSHTNVPLDTIAALLQIKTAFSSVDSVIDRRRPLCLLNGPPRFGKSTIAHRVREWMSQTRPEVQCVHILLNKLRVKDERSFWNALATNTDLHSGSADEDSFVKLATRDQKSGFCLILDDMDCILSSRELAGKLLLAVVHRWKHTPCSCGFLGIGRHSLRIQLQLSELSESQWESLMFMLQNDGLLTESDVDAHCRPSGEETMVNRLWRMDKLGKIRYDLGGLFCWFAHQGND